MTRLALCVVVWSPCAVLFADEPRKPASVLEGAWQEPVLPGEDAAARYRVTIVGDKVTIRHREQVLTGTVVVGTDSNPLRVTMTITNVEGNGSHVQGTYIGVYEAAKDRVSFQFNPYPVKTATVRAIQPDLTLGPPEVIQVAEARNFGGLGLAPITLTLHKAKK
jgi:hypothetical protein